MKYVHQYFLALILASIFRFFKVVEGANSPAAGEGVLCAPFEGFPDAGEKGCVTA